MIGGEGTETVWDVHGARGSLRGGRVQRRPRVGEHRAPTAQGVDGQLLGARRDGWDTTTCRSSFRRFGLNTFPPSVGREVHAALLELVSAGKIKPVIGRVISMEEVAARGLEDHANPPHERVGPWSTSPTDDGVRAGRAARRRRLPQQPGSTTFGPDTFRPGFSTRCVRPLGDESAAQRPRRGGDAGACLVGSLSNPTAGSSTGSRRNPEVREERIEAPIVVVGMFRAGTTLLSRLFDQDPGNRALLMWEAGRQRPAAPRPVTTAPEPRVDAVHASKPDARPAQPAGIEVVHHEQGRRGDRVHHGDGAGTSRA